MYYASEYVMQKHQNRKISAQPTSGERRPDRTCEADSCKRRVKIVRGERACR